MRMILIWAAALAIGVLAWGAEPATTPAKKTSPAKKSVATASPARKNGVPVRHSSKASLPRTSWRNRQAIPSPERYQEIQTALVAKGFLAPDAVGSWTQASVDALRRFQAQQNLESTGKINSLSLIALGLGPKYDTPGRGLDVNPGQLDR
jgi:hypothetical protein